MDRGPHASWWESDLRQPAMPVPDGVFCLPWVLRLGTWGQQTNDYSTQVQSVWLSWAKHSGLTLHQLLESHSHHDDKSLSKSSQSVECRSHLALGQRSEKTSQSNQFALHKTLELTWSQLLVTLVFKIKPNFSAPECPLECSWTWSCD